MEYAQLEPDADLEGCLLTMRPQGPRQFESDAEVAFRLSDRSPDSQWDILWARYAPEVSRDGTCVQIAIRLLALEDVPPLSARNPTGTMDPAVKAALNLEKAVGPRAKRGKCSNAEKRGGARNADKAEPEDADQDDAGSSSDSDDGFLDEEEKNEWAQAALQARIDPDPAPEPPAPDAKLVGTTVFSGDGSRRLGRISYVHRNPTNPSMMLYCVRHQCYKSVSGKRSPTEAGALRWLAFGAGPACESKAAHLKVFEEMVLTG
jgi:hypothetical protein